MSNQGGTIVSGVILNMTTKVINFFYLPHILPFIIATFISYHLVCEWYFGGFSVVLLLIQFVPDKTVVLNCTLYTCILLLMLHIYFEKESYKFKNKSNTDI